MQERLILRLSIQCIKILKIGMRRKKRCNGTMCKGTHMGQKLQRMMLLKSPITMQPHQTKGKKDLLLLLVLASTSSLEPDQGINQQLRVFFKEKQSKRGQICV